jgi:hypothetical protein
MGFIKISLIQIGAQTEDPFAQQKAVGILLVKPDFPVFESAGHQRVPAQSVGGIACFLAYFEINVAQDIATEAFLEIAGGKEIAVASIVLPVLKTNAGLCGRFIFNSKNSPCKHTQKAKR